MKIGLNLYSYIKQLLGGLITQENMFVKYQLM